MGALWWVWTFAGSSPRYSPPPTRHLSQSSLRAKLSRRETTASGLFRLGKRRSPSHRSLQTDGTLLSAHKSGDVPAADVSLFICRDLQYTPSEDRAVRMVPNEIQIYNPSAWSKGAVDKLRVEGVSAVAPSPGQYPALAVFVAEKKVRGQRWSLKSLVLT